MITPEQFKRVEELLYHAIELPIDRRREFLDEHCDDDPVVRAEVERLLQVETKASALSNLGHRVGSMVRAATGTGSERPGDRVGAYVLRRRIGEGGMGVVYEAEQREPVRRTVALKLIKWGMDTARVVARFDGERQALAMMDHPAIARVLDAGANVRGRPFFVMEYVDGVSITRYCDEHRLDTGRRLQLFVEVCQGIRHAHQKGIIHRDLKPPNVLVTTIDGRPVPKIIDFGVAKATDQRLTERTVFSV